MVGGLLSIGSAVHAGSISPGTVVDLDSQPGQTYTDGSGAVWSTADIHPAGNGVFQPFVRETSPGSSQYENGFNTDAAKQLDNLGGAWTHSLLLSSIAQVTVNGTAYYQFAMNANQTGVNPIISIDEVEIFQSNLANLTGYVGTNLSYGLATDHFTSDPTATMVYNEDKVVDTTININSRQNNGQGIGTADMTLLVPVALFTGNQQYVVLYSSFGNPNDLNNGQTNKALTVQSPSTSFYAANAGFEDWNATEGSTPLETTTPLPKTASSGLVLLASAAGLFLVQRIRRNSKSASV